MDLLGGCHKSFSLFTLFFLLLWLHNFIWLSLWAHQSFCLIKCVAQVPIVKFSNHLYSSVPEFLFLLIYIYIYSISLHWTSRFVHVLFYRFDLVVHLYSLIIHRATLIWLFWVLCQAICRSFLSDQLLEVYFAHSIRSCFLESLCVCNFALASILEEIATSPCLSRMTLKGKDLHQAVWLDIQEASQTFPMDVSSQNLCV